MLTALALAATLSSLPTPREEVVLSNKDMVEAPRSGRKARLLVQGTAGMLAGLALGFIVQESGVASAVPCVQGLLPNCPDGRAEGLRAGFGLGAGLGVLGAGEALKGEGSMAGMGLGMGLGATCALLISSFSPELGTVATLTMPLAGALAGYEVGMSDPDAKLSLRPNFSVGNGKVNVGLTGEF